MKDFLNKNKKTIISVSQIVAVFFVTFLVLYIFGLVPENFKTSRNFSVNFDFGRYFDKKETDKKNEYKGEIVEEVEEEEQTYTTPDSISIKKLGVIAEIEKPQSQRVDILDQALELGPVYYPGSGVVEGGNMFIFGHSASAFSFINNSAYKVFNDLDKLEIGDEIEIEADGEIYVYSVDVVKMVDENTAYVDFTGEGRKLTLSTCNTFGEPQDRWVVEAVFKEKRSI